MADRVANIEFDEWTGALPRNVEIHGHNFVLHQDANAGIGGTVWDCSLVLAGYLFSEDFPSGHFTNKIVLELGSGTGLCGLVASHLGAKVILTDVGHHIDLLKRNVSSNCTSDQSNRTSVCEYFWGEPTDFATHFDYIIASDVVYHADLFEPLLRTFEKFVSENVSIYLFIYLY